MLCREIRERGQARFADLEPFKHKKVDEVERLSTN